MINTNKIGSFQKEDKAEEYFQLYTKLEAEDRSLVLSKITNWLIKKVEADNKARADKENNNSQK